MLPTVGDLLGLDVIRRGSPQVVAGSGGLGARVRWVHVLEASGASSASSASGRTVYDEAAGWLFTPVGARGEERVGTSPDGLVIGVGATAGSIRDVRRSFLEASQVADVAAERPDDWSAGGGSDWPAFYRLADLRLRGLLHLLRDDPRVQTFVERELGPLLASEPDTSLLDVLAAYLAAGGNKAEAAKSSHLARPTFYERLRRIERILGTDLGSAESRTSLHVAMLALDASRMGSAQTG